MDGKIYVCIVLLILIAYIKNVCSDSWAIFRKGTIQLEDLSHYVCGLTTGDSFRGGLTRRIPWFCVPSTRCSLQTNPRPSIIHNTEPEYSCGDLYYNDGNDVCCYIGDLTPSISDDYSQILPDEYNVYEFTGPGSGRSQSYPEQEIVAFDEYKKILSEEFSTAENDRVLASHEVCGIFPLGKKQLLTIYTPYICMTPSECVANPVVDWAALEYNLGDAFCSRGKYPDRTKCCHLSAISRDISSYEYKELNPSQAYAPGFRSSFMCEQYVRQVCIGWKDLCTLRILDREDYAYPGEFPHQALIGVSSQKIQFFHCQGSIVSKNFILSAYECRTYRGLITNLALLSELNLTAVSSQEFVTYIKRHYSQPREHMLLLLKIWRPLRFNPFMRPACLDWYSKKGSYSSRTYDYGEAYLTGFGAPTKSSKLSDTLKRYKFTYVDESDNFPINRCFIKQPEKIIELFGIGTYDGYYYSRSEKHLCLTAGQKYTAVLNPKPKPDPMGGQSYYDLGAPFQVLRRYCIWNIYGVAIGSPIISKGPPTLIETIPSSIPWLENVIWRYDFDFLEFNLTLPSCKDKHGIAFQNLLFLKDNFRDYF